MISAAQVEGMSSAAQVEGMHDQCSTGRGYVQCRSINLLHASKTCRRESHVLIDLVSNDRQLVLQSPTHYQLHKIGRKIGVQHSTAHSRRARRRVQITQSESAVWFAVKTFSAMARMARRWSRGKTEPQGLEGLFTKMPTVLLSAPTLHSGTRCQPCYYLHHCYSA